VPEAGGRDRRFVCGLISVLALAALGLPASAAADPLGSVTEFTTSPPPGTSLGAIAPGADGDLWVCWWTRSSLLDLCFSLARASRVASYQLRPENFRSVKN
jgi:hypothetical protein